jgi:hypothetical protein
VDINNLHRRNNYHCLKGDIRPDLMTQGGGQEMTEDIASRDYEAEIYLLKAEIKRLGEFEDYYIRTHKHVYVAAIVQPYEEKIKRLEAEIEALKCCGNCKAFSNCHFMLGGAVDIGIKLPASSICDKWEDRK